MVTILYLDQWKVEQVFALEQNDGIELVLFLICLKLANFAGLCFTCRAHYSSTPSVHTSFKCEV